MLKFNLNIRTKDGLLVENLTVHADDRTHAETKIRKVYLKCEIVSCETEDAHTDEDQASMESIISLISKQDKN